MPLRVHALHERDAVFGQGAGLIGREHINAPEVVERCKLLHDDAVLFHPQCAFRKIARHDERQKLRREADRDRDREEKYLERIMFDDEDVQ